MSSLLLQEVHLTNFRLYERKALTFTSGLNVLVGENGAGKSSVLEGVYAALTGSSFRSNQLIKLIRYDTEGFGTGLQFQRAGINHKIAFSFDGKQKKYQIDGVQTANRSDILGSCPIVLFSQEDVRLIKGAPSERRKYLDVALAQSNPLYCHHLSRYMRAVKQRNVCLRQEMLDTITAWEGLLASSGAYIIAERARFVESVNQLLFSIHQELTGTDDSFFLTYQPFACWKKGMEIAEIAEHLQECYEKERAKEIEQGSTKTGPHRDDLQMYLKENQVRYFASDGQQKGCAAALKLAEWHVIREKVDVPPVLAIDDLGTSLDTNRRQRLLSYASTLAQVIVTAVSVDELQGIDAQQQSVNAL